MPLQEGGVDGNYSKAVGWSADLLCRRLGRSLDCRSTLRRKQTNGKDSRAIHENLFGLAFPIHNLLGCRNGMAVTTRNKKGGTMNKKTKVYLIIVSLAVVFSLLLTLIFTAWRKKPVKADYEYAEDFEAALNAGEDLIGKIVSFTVREVNPNSAFGYSIYAGEHLNFCSSKNPHVKAGDTITVKATSINSLFGSWIIYYTKIK